MATAKKRATKRKVSSKSKSKGAETLIDQARVRLEELRDIEQIQDARKAYQQIWRAGLGAYARSTEALTDAAKDTTEDSEKFFKQLVKDGEKLERRARKELDELRDKVGGRWEELSDRANARVSKLESAFDKRVAQAYNRLGLPAKKDIDALNAKIDKLQRTMEGKPPAKAAAGKKVAARKTAGKARTTTAAPA